MDASGLDLFDIHHSGSAYEENFAELDSNTAAPIRPMKTFKPRLQAIEIDEER